MNEEHFQCPWSVYICILYLLVWSIYVYFIYEYGPSKYTLSMSMVHLCTLYLCVWSIYVHFIYEYGPSMYTLSIRMVNLCTLYLWVWAVFDTLLFKACTESIFTHLLGLKLIYNSFTVLSVQTKWQTYDEYYSKTKWQTDK